MKKLLPNLQLESGISLMEIVISMVIVGFVVMVIANVPQSIRLVGTTSKESLAKDIVNKKMEDLRTQGYSLLSNGTTSISDARLNTLPAPSSSVIVSDCPITVCTALEHTKKVEVKVSWNDSGKVKSVSVTTFISEGGLQ